MTIDLNNLSLKELKDLQANVVKTIANFEDRKRKEAIVELEEIARAKGFTLAELTGATPTRKRAAAVAQGHRTGHRARSQGFTGHSAKSGLD